MTYLTKPDKNWDQKGIFVSFTVIFYYFKK